MKTCYTCQKPISGSVTTCPSCGVVPEIINGFCSYAPELCLDDSGFKPNFFSELAQLEESNFWFRSRNNLILWAIQKYCDKLGSVLEIGCGTGYVLSAIAKNFRETRLSGSDIFTEGLEFASNRIPSAELMQMDARNIPFFEEFDVIGAFDVLEHIEEDEKVLSQIYTALNPQGHLIITVPQHAWLWSSMDQFACHARRYSCDDLCHKIIKAGFSIVRTTSFVTALLPAMMSTRIIRRNQSAESIDLKKELQLAPWINNLFYKIMQTEVWLIKKGINFPVGGSRLVIAKKM